MHLTMLYSGIPLPVMLNIGRKAKDMQYGVELIYVDRDRGDLVIDGLNFSSHVLRNKCRTKFLTRFLFLPILIIRIINILKKLTFPS